MRMIETPLPYAQRAEPLFYPLLGFEQPVLLHSADRTSRFGRFDIMTADPLISIHYEQEVLQVGSVAHHTLRPIEQLGKLLPTTQPTKANPSYAPFTGGFVGYLGYGLHQTLERQSPAPDNPDDLPSL